MRLNGKKILLGISGSIAAYKAAEIIRFCIKEGAEVQVIMTSSAHDFITPLTLSTLSRNPVLTEFSDPASGAWNNHVELGMWADAFLIAPASANTIAKMARGICDNLLSAVYMSARCPVFIAPAMDLDMFQHTSTHENISRLITFGNRIIGPAKGELASGLHGDGRMEEPETIVSYLIKALNPEPVLAGKKVLITAGPTRESIDAVRYISNSSSGKMGIALAEEMADRGAHVTAIVGPGSVLSKNGAIEIRKITTAHEMHELCMELFPRSDITIMAAAVADFVPTASVKGKIKKKDAALQIDLQPTIDILAEMGKQKNKKQLLVGFALETENEIENAKSKLERKNLDLIVLNSLNDEGAGFNTETNKITIIDKNKTVTGFELKTKKQVAADITDKIITLLK